MPDQPDCFVCKAPYAEHNWQRVIRGWCPVNKVWKHRGVYADMYWPQAADGTSAESWEPHPVLSPLEQVLVNNIETIREVLDDLLSVVDDELDLNQPPDLLERAYLLRREIAELSGELEATT